MRSIEVLASINTAGEGMTSKATRDRGGGGAAASRVETHAIDEATSNAIATGMALSIKIAASH